MQERIENKLSEVLSPSYLNVKNMSHLHAGHAGDDGSGESHFSVEIISSAFEGVNRVNAQRMVFDALRDEMKFIHALSIIKCGVKK